ncbi:universal stress protein [Isoptericola chiayiensis]|uniref:universal stress protein n=1 Tax=Isoptericola chiayiensis TaxID=579446 RepID=UPI001FE2C79D|nr:universal stress protein [Isoptericola chiayiensis]
MRFAATVARALDAELLVVHAVPADRWGQLPWTPSRPDRDTVLSSATDELAAAVEALRADAPDVTVTPRVVDGGAGPALAQLSETADVVVVGCRGRGGFQGLLLGSTSQSALRGAQCPVLVVRGAEA